MDPLPPKLPLPRSPRRRAFLQPPPPVHPLRSPEIRSALGLALLLLLILAFWLLFPNRTPHALERVFAAQVAVPGEGAATQPTLEERREERRRLLPTLFEGTLLDAADGTDFEETDSYRRLLEILWAMPPEEVSGRATRLLDHREALETPDLLRGEFVRVRGILAESEWIPTRLKRPLAGREDVWRAFLTQTDASDWVAFDLPDRPEWFELRRDVVEIEGIFYRTVRYEARNGKFREVPYVLARNLRVTGLGRAKTGIPLSLAGVLLLALAVSAAIMLGARRGRAGAIRKSAGFREMFEKRLREEGRARGPSPPT
ncbi:MAG TPA: hypothetical protein VKF62_01400 [Planctomycetota bacterium]|nr:hypothetical protein [Planctomycetota bacterium]